MNKNLDLENYILANIDREDPVLAELDRETNMKVLYPRMISGHLQGQILSMLSQMIQPRNILEIGTFTGYSAICLTKGLMPEGKLVTIELNDELETFAARYFKKAGITNSVIQIIGSALQEIPKLNTHFDLVFIDGDKREYTDYYNLIFDKIAPGGYIIADNTLWGGKVTQTLAHNDEQTKGVLLFNETIKNDNRIEKVILPIRDGMTIMRKK